MKLTSFGATLLPCLFPLAGCADVLGLDVYDGTGGTGGTTTSAGGGTTTSDGGGGTGGTTSTTSTGGGGSGGTTTTTTPTLAPVCDPGAKEACYEGFPLTEGIGECTSGERTCDGDGQWGACLGQVLPALESCTTQVIDESCDNLAKCTGAFRWAKRFGGAGDQIPTSVAAGPDGSVHVVGQAGGELDFGGGALPAGGGLDFFVARRDRDGKHLWAKRFGDDLDQKGVDVAVDAAGNVVILGNAAGMIDFGGGALPIAGAADLVVAKLAPDGTHLWSKSFGGALAETAGAVAVDPAGDVLLAGSDPSSVLLRKLSAADGSTLWNKSFPTAGVTGVTDLAVAKNGDVILLAYSAASIDFGGGAPPPHGNFDVLVARFDTSGLPLWSHSYGGTGNDYAYSAAVDGAGAVALVGHTDGAFQFDPLVLAETPNKGALDVAVWKINADGTTAWGKLLGDAGAQYGFGIAADLLGNIVVSGTFASTITLDKPLTAGAAIYDHYLTKLAPGGTALWSLQIPNAAGAQPRVAVDPLGNIAFTTGLVGTTNLGGGPLTSTNADIVTATFAP